MTQVTPPSEPLGTSELEFATFHEAYLSRYIQLADAKAGTALVFTGGTLGYLLGQDPFLAALRLQSTCPMSILAVLSGLLLSGSAVLSFVVIAPRGSKPGTGLVYWEDVARLTATEFIEAVHGTGPDGLARERLSHTHTIAGICERKYRWLRRALGLGAAGLVAALICRMTM